MAANGVCLLDLGIDAAQGDFMSGQDGKENESSFKVVERRRFQADGTVKKDAVDAEPRKAEPQIPKESAGERKATVQPTAAQSSPIDFMTFVASLGATALAALGALPKGAAGDIPENTDLAREYIDILGMLQAKTRGNLTREEEASLQRLLTDLRLQFVEKTRGKGKSKH
jgi:hypothetical protein